MKILSFGSLNLDHVYQMPHFVRAGETVVSLGYERFLGGKGFNQTIALARAGANVYHAGRIGEDGAALTEYMKANGVNCDCTETVSTPTGHAIIQIEQGTGGNCILTNGGANHTVDKAFAEKVLSRFDAGDMLLMQNEISAVDEIMKIALKKGIDVAFNPSPITPRLTELPLEALRILIVNEVEGAALSGETEFDRVLDTLTQKYPRCCVVLTVGKEGVLCASPEGRYFLPSVRVRAVDTTGAGDTFAGYFVASRALGLSVPDALARANRAAAISVTRPGAAQSIPTLAEVLAD